MSRSLAERYIASRRAHPIRWELIDLAAGTAAVIAAWLLLGQTVGIAAAILWALLTLLGLIALVVRMNAERRNR